MTCPQNAGLPIEIWLKITSFLPTDDTCRFQHLNITFWHAALDIKYSTLEFTHNHPKGLIELLRFYSEPFIAPRVKCIRVEPGFGHTVTKRPPWIHVLEALIPLLHNVIEMILYPFHRDKITRRLLNLLVQCGPRIRKLWLCLNEGLPGPSLGMAEEFKRKHISLPSLRDLRVIYMPSTCCVWNPIIHKMISESVELETLHVCLSDKSNFTTNRSGQLFLVPSGLPQIHPRLNFARLAGWDKTEPHRVLHFLRDYRFQLRTLHVGKIPSQVISRISELCALSSLSVLTDTMTLYSELLIVVNGLTTLRELHVVARKVEFTAYSSQAAFPPVPCHPLLESFSLETPIFNLLYLHRFATGLPALRCMSIRLIFAVPPSWKRPHLACGSPQMEVYEIVQGIHFRPDHSSRKASLRAAILQLESIPSWELETLYIHVGGTYSDLPLSTDFVECFPNIVPSLTDKKDFYRDWRPKIEKADQFIPDE